jgi:hypothetical protein
LGVWRGVDGPTPWKTLTVDKLLTIAARRKESNRKRGQGSSWTVEPEEEEEGVICSMQAGQEKCMQDFNRET